LGDLSLSQHIPEVIMFKKILLATDGSEPAAHAANYATSLALQYGASVVVVHSFNPVPAFLGEPYYSAAVYSTLDEAETLANDMAERLRQAGVAEVEAVFVAGPATEVILDVAQAREPDLIVIGARGLGTWRGFFLGSVSTSVAQRAEVPVLVVK
jgi:nucleotide-binding universal stress UspA family protein